MLDAKGRGCDCNLAPCSCRHPRSGDNANEVQAPPNFFTRVLQLQNDPRITRRIFCTESFVARCYRWTAVHAPSIGYLQCIVATYSYLAYADSPTFPALIAFLIQSKSCERPFTHCSLTGKCESYYTLLSSRLNATQSPHDR